VVEEESQHTLPEWLAEQLDETQLAALGMGPWPRTDLETIQLQEEAERWYGALPTMFQGRAPLIVPGHAAEQILKAIDSNDIDLAVLGARRQGPVRRLFLGSTSTHIVNHAACSVLIVREPKWSHGDAVQ
jgi:nucleotide-binding universal stress UspA family protein